MTSQARGNNVFLIGPMGSGKTAVGKHLARVLHLTFYDSDLEIEHRTGVDIPYIFEKEGEAGFRDREREVIDSLTSLENVVVATGERLVASKEYIPLGRFVAHVPLETALTVVRASPPLDLLQVAIDYITANSPVDPQVEGRIVGPPSP